MHASHVPEWVLGMHLFCTLQMPGLYRLPGITGAGLCGFWGHLIVL